MKCSFRLSILASAAIAALTLSGPALSQTTTVLTTLWETKVGSNDYMSTNSTTERDTYANRGAFIYMPSTNISGTTAFYRLFNGTEHMDSNVAGEAGYTTEGALGYIWTSPSAVPGIDKPNRIYNSTNDHAEVRNGDTISGYTNIDAPNLYGYLRYNNTATVLNSLSAGGVAIGSNNVTGGAIWSWVWNSTEFVDHADYGREIQSAVAWQASGVVHNPTEAGSEAANSGGAGNNQGSPIYQSSNSGNTQTTRSIPLEWSPGLWGGNTTTHPVIYSDMMIGKDITLDWNGMGAVAKYVTYVYTPSSISSASVETPTGYMPSTFNRYYTYDASSQTLTEVFPGSCISGYIPYTPSSGHGGVIISNSAQDKAMAVGAKTFTAGGAIQKLGLYDCRSAGSTSKWNAFTEGTTLSAGANTFTTFISSGTLSGVTANLRTLYLNGDI
jgi:hypothetical protein